MIKSFIKKLDEAKLSKVEREIAEKIKRNLYEMAFLTGQQFAKECGVNSSTITRFAQKLGYSGYPELKTQLQQIYKKSYTPFDIYQNYQKYKGKKSVIDLTYQQDIKNIQAMMNNLNQNDLLMIAEKINKANKIIIAAIGASETLVDLFYYYFDAIGKTYTKLKGFGISKKMEIMEVSDKDVIIGISFQRILKEVKEVIDFANKHNATTIAITDSKANSLSVAADYSLIAPVVPTTFSLSITAPVLLINFLLNTMAAKNPKKITKFLKKTRESWNTLPIFADY